MPQVENKCGEWRVFPPQAIGKEAGGKLGVFPAPPGKLLVETVDGKEIRTRKGEVAGFDTAQPLVLPGKTGNPQEVMTAAELSLEAEGRQFGKTANGESRGDTPPHQHPFPLDEPS